MADRGDLVTTKEAARLLGVSTRRIQQLADSPALDRVARGLLERASVERYLAAHTAGRTRAWAEHTAWGVIAVLSGDEAGWLGQTQTSRLRARLREITDVEDLLTRLRHRAAVNVYTGHRSAAGRLNESLIGAPRSRLGLVDDATGVDGYLATSRLDEVVRRYGLRPDGGGWVVLRATGFDLDVVRHLASHADVLAAVDAATSIDPRERGVGQRAVADILGRTRR